MQLKLNFYMKIYANIYANLTYITSQFLFDGMQTIYQ